MTKFLQIVGKKQFIVLSLRATVVIQKTHTFDIKREARWRWVEEAGEFS